ncbi:MAG TPA: tetratricopeptide repeat protein [Candidatus Limnocylindrales bacterium]
MIERLLAAERALAEGQLDQAERLFAQVAEADERNAIAVVGLAEVARTRGDEPAARELLARALAIDPEEAAAARMLAASADGPARPAPGGPAPARRALAARLAGWLRRLVRRGA